MIAHEPRSFEVFTLPAPPPGVAACVCQNLAITADAFARLTNEELFALPSGLRTRTRNALVGVWQILDLLRRLEESDRSTLDPIDAEYAEIAASLEGEASIEPDDFDAGISTPSWETEAVLCAERASWSDPLWQETCAGSAGG